MNGHDISCVSLPRRYIEELDSCSSPGVVFKKAAFFEEVMRSASSEKLSISISSKRTAGRREVADHGVTARILDSGESQSHPTEVHTSIVSEEAESQPSETPQGEKGEEQGQLAQLQHSEATLLISGEECKATTTSLEDEGICFAGIRDSTDQPETQVKENKDPEYQRVMEHLVYVICFVKCSLQVGKGGDKEKLSIRSSVSTLAKTSAAGFPKKFTYHSTTPQPFALATDKGKSSWSTKAQSEARVTKQAVNCKYEPSTIRGVNAFHLKSEERAEKRKEFYARLEERQAARELEKNQLEARTKEETEAALRKLRQSLTFKAKPMPNFYHDSPQKKSEAPTTRAVSPTLGRRKCKTVCQEGSSHHVRLCQQQRDNCSSSSK